MTLPRQSVVVQRTGSDLPGLIDQLERRIYFRGLPDVVAGDSLAFQSRVRRVEAQPVVWGQTGLVVSYEDAPAVLPDLGQLLRGGGIPVLDETTGDLTVTAGAQVWSGACLVEPAQSDGSNPEIGDQQVGIVPFTVTVPLAVTDVRPGDLFKVTSSRDQRLLTRTLVVKAIRASSTALTR